MRGTMDGTEAKRAILAGDPDGLRAFYDGHFRALYAFCWHRLGRDHHAAEEVVQQTMVAALERIESYEPSRGDLHTWLAFLARNAIRRANAERRRLAPMNGGDGAGAGAVAAAAAEETSDERAETAERVAVALERLPARYRVALTRKYVRGESMREIAAACGTSEKAVESLLGRAREAFRAAFVSLTGGAEPCASRSTSNG